MGVNGQDVAKAAKVSTATVSRVFSRNPAISKEVRERVLAAAKRLSYAPRLKNGNRNVAVITLSHITTPLRAHTDMALNALAQALSGHGYRMEIIPAESIELLRTGAYCGAVAVGGSCESLVQSWDSKFNMPLICINHYGKVSGNVHTICSNDGQGLRLAVESLRKRGHRRIALALFSMRKLREESFRMAMCQAGLPVENALIREMGWDNVYEQLGQLLKRKPTAIICSGESFGLRMAYALNLFGKRIPEEISLIAYEWSMVSECCVPPQTTLCQDVEGMARATTEMLDNYLDGTQPKRNILLDYHLLERESVGEATP